jgi:hypothetical protein
MQHGENMTDTTRIFYLRDETGFPIATVATDLLMTLEGVAVGVVYGIAIWNPKDKFNKALSREIAIGRMDLNGKILNVRENFKSAVMADIADRKALNEGHDEAILMPNKVRRAAERWLIRNMNKKHGI